MNIDTRIGMNDGYEIPQLGLGVFLMDDPAVCEKAVRTALDEGYRHIDTAACYGNEEAVGRAVRDCGLPRDSVFVTTKVFIQDLGAEKTPRAFEKSLRNLGLDYVDLYLIHWPLREGVAEAWEAMQKLRERELIRSIGVSNFTVRRFEEQFFPRTEVVPAVDQIELHPFCTRTDLLAYCREKGIVAEGYSPLARAQQMEDPLLNALAGKYGKSVAQVMIRWQLQQGIVVIPKSEKPERIRENAQVFDFELDEADMQAIAGLDRELYTIAWRPEEGWF